MDTSFDFNLQKIIGLKWLPWVGSDYGKDENPKLLIIGETHYHDNTEWSIKQHDRIDFTRLIVDELGIQKIIYNGSKMFPNLHRVIFNNTSFDSDKFWNLISFYNFIQRPMATIKSRPSVTDFSNGWPVFFNVIDILKPKVCLFIGTTSAHTLSEALKTSNFEMTFSKWEDKISRVEPINITIKHKMGYEVKLIFIRHTSRGFSWSKWNQFLNTHFSHLMQTLSEKSK
jgi:hypothetical protein